MTFLLTVAAALAWAGVQAPSGPPDARVTLRWRYKDVPARMRVFALAEGSAKPLWETGAVDKLADLPLGEELDGGIPLWRGFSRTLVLVMANGSGKPLSFFAAPHSMTPAERSLGCEFWCLCVNDVFTAPPGKTWYRVVKLGLKDKAAGGDLAITHELVGGRPAEAGF